MALPRLPGPPDCSGPGSSSSSGGGSCAHGGGGPSEGVCAAPPRPGAGRAGRARRTGHREHLPPGPGRSGPTGRHHRRTGAAGRGTAHGRTGDPGSRLGAGSAEASTVVSIFQSAPIMSIAAWRRISSLPPPRNESRAPAVLKPTVSVVASTPMTWAFWLSRIQVNRRIFLTWSSRSGQIRRTSVRDSCPAPPEAGPPEPPRRGLLRGRRGLGRGGRRPRRLRPRRDRAGRSGRVDPAAGPAAHRSDRQAAGRRLRAAHRSAPSVAGVAGLPAAGAALIAGCRAGGPLLPTAAGACRLVPAPALLVGDSRRPHPRCPRRGPAGPAAHRPRPRAGWGEPWPRGARRWTAVPRPRPAARAGPCARRCRARRGRPRAAGRGRTPAPAAAGAWSRRASRSGRRPRCRRPGPARPGRSGRPGRRAAPRRPRGVDEAGGVRVGHRGGDDQVAQAAQHVLGEAAGVLAGLDHLVDDPEHTRPVTGGEGVDDLVEQVVGV